MQIKNGYKLHGLCTAQGQTASQNINKFYGTYEEAFAAASKMVQQEGCNGIVIYAAIALVRRKEAPVEVIHIDAVATSFSTSRETV